MSVDIKIGPPVLTINRGSTFMVTDLNGEIDQASAHGVFAEDTRFISSYRLFINGIPWECVTSATITYFAARLELTNPLIPQSDGRGPIEPRTIALTLERHINGGLREYFHMVNYSQAAVEFRLELAMSSDFADIFEVRSGGLTRRGRIRRTWDSRVAERRTTYEHDGFLRRLVYRVEESTSPPVLEKGV